MSSAAEGQVTDAEEEMRVDPQRASQLLSAVRSIQSAVEAAAPAGRAAARLVAVSKLKPASDVLALHESEARLTHFGENYLQELERKASLLPRTIDWHFIGGLQTNKCRPLAEGIPNLWAVESVDTTKKADQLEKGRAALFANDADGKLTGDLQKEHGLRVFVQVNTSGEQEKSGVEPGDDAVALCRHIRDRCPHLKLQGVMTIGAIARSQASAEGEENEDFVRLREERAKIAKALEMSEEELELSMGMSADFEEAIRQGSSQVRVGSQIFGARPPKQSEKAKAEVEGGKS